MFEWPRVDWATLRAARWDRVGHLMRERGLDHLLLSGHDNIRYATDFRSLLIAEGFDWYAALVDVTGEATIFVPYVAEDVTSPQPDLPWVKRFVAAPSWSPSVTQAPIWIRLLARELRSGGARRVGVDLLGFQLVDGLRQEATGVQLAPIGRELYEVRQVKMADEIRLLEAASAVTALAAAAARAAVVEGMADFDVLAVAMGEMQRAGAEFLTHSVCVTRGSPQAANWFARGQRLWAGDTFFFDVGCFGPGGYGSDICRTGFVGEPPAAVRHAYRALLEAYAAGQDVARPGVLASRIDRTINEALRKQGCPDTPYAMGHGVGLRVCELPLVYRPEMMTHDAALEEGMVIALEPETTVVIDGTPVVVKVEDTFVVDRGGLRRLTLCGHAPA